MFSLASVATRNVAANACHPKQKATNRCARTRPIKVGSRLEMSVWKREGRRLLIVRLSRLLRPLLFDARARASTLATDAAMRGVVASGAGH